MEPSAPPPIPAIPLPYFTPEHLREMEIAKKGSRKIRRAVSVANFDGWTLAIFGALTLVMGFTNFTNILLSLGLGAVAYVELRYAARLKRLQSEAARTLGFNQLALAAILIAYACWQLYAASRNGGTAAALGVEDPQVVQMLGPMQDLANSVVHAVYAALIIFAILAQGGMAFYYFTRVRLIRDYAAKTPEWIIQLQEAGFTL
jgi:hypothetical protein